MSEKIICLNTRKARKKSEKLGTKVEIYMDYAGLSFCQALSKALKEVQGET